MGITVKHSGAIGDIIYALPYISSLSNDIDFYIGEHTFVRGIADQFTSQHVYDVVGNIFPLMKTITDPLYKNYTAMKRLLEAQLYINQVLPVTVDMKYDHDIDDFRKSWSDSKSIIETVNGHFGYSGYVKGTPFLSNIPFDKSFENVCVCARSPRAIGLDGEGRYRRMIEWIVENEKPDKFLFLGIEKEFDYFTDKIWKEITYFKTTDFYDAAIIINSCPYGVFNSSAPLAIAAALGKKRYVENPMSCILNVIYMHDGKERYF